jgi:hypothetical protein
MRVLQGERARHVRPGRVPAAGLPARECETENLFPQVLRALLAASHRGGARLGVRGRGRTSARQRHVRRSQQALQVSSRLGARAFHAAHVRAFFSLLFLSFSLLSLLILSSLSFFSLLLCPARSPAAFAGPIGNSRSGDDVLQEEGGPET